MKKILICYSHKDEEYKNKLLKQLQVLELEGICDIWDDNRIVAGSNWFKEIQQAIEQASVAVILVSVDFLTSQFFLGIGVLELWKRQQKKGLIVMPLLVRPCPWQKSSWLSDVKVFPYGDQTLSEIKPINQIRLLNEFVKLIYDKLSSKSLKALGSKERSNTQLLTSLPPRLIQLIGRVEELATLESRFKSYNRVVLLNGVGGIGKTEVCKAFFMDHYEQYDYAAWVDWAGTVRDSLVYALAGHHTTFIEPAENDTLDQRFEKLMARLSHMGERFLLVLDNIENSQDKDLVTLATLPKNIKILVSSRANIEGFEVMPLDVLSERECMDLFYRFYHGTKDDLSLKELIGLCGCHTLTVELAARTADKGAKPIAWLLEQLKQKGFNLNPVLTETFPILKHGETGTQTFFGHLLTLFDLSGLTKAEKVVLAPLSLLPSVYIPMVWVKEWLVLDNLDEVNGLVKRGWLRKGDGFLVYMHPVIQEVAFHALQPTAETCRVLIESLANNLFKNPGDNPLDKQVFVPYAERLVLRLASEDKDKELARLANNLSATYLALGQLERALEFQLKALSIREKVLGENHPDLATSYNNMSMIYQDMGQLERALEFQLKDIKISEKVLGESHPDFATSYNNVSMIYQDMGQLERALEFQLKALSIREKILGENHPDLATSYNNVSMIYQDMGQLERALEFQLKAVKIFEKVLGENHPDLATSYNNVSQIYQDMGQLERALEFQLKALSIREKILGENHPDLATSHNNLCTIYYNMGQLERALEFQLKALTIQEKVLGENHPDLATSYNNVSQIFQAMGQLERALEFQSKALNIREQVLGENHPSLATSYHNLSTLYLDMKKYTEALTYSEKAVFILQKLFPNGHPDLIIVEKNREGMKRLIGNK